MKRYWAHQRTMVGIMFLASVCVVHVTAGRAHSQEKNTNPGNPTILQAIQNLQSSVNGLQATVNSLQSAVNDIATNGARTNPRLFYLSKDRVYDGSHALTACEQRFHMASAWEIVDPSNLQYDTQLGLTADDSGEGPPSLQFAPVFAQGWIRTGSASSDTGSAGNANCSAWTTNSASADGTIVALPNSWLGGSAARIEPWVTTTSPCSFQQRVWCVEDFK